MSSQSYTSCHHHSGGTQRSFASKCNDFSEQPFCRCNICTRVRTSKTEGNPGRRFFGFPMFLSSANDASCGYFQWLDPPTCPRGDEILPPLYKKIKEMEAEARMLRTKEKCMLTSMTASWILCAAITLCIYIYFRYVKMGCRGDVTMSLY